MFTENGINAFRSTLLTTSKCDSKCDGKGPQIYVSIVMLSTVMYKSYAFLCKDGIQNLCSQTEN